MGCATATIKYLVFIFNTLCALIGIATIVIAALDLKNMESYGKTVLIVIIVLGSIVFLISFFGCFGAIRENVCLTWTYAVLMALLIVGNIVILATQMKHLDGETIAKTQVETAWNKNLKGSSTYMDFLQGTYQCCGTTSPESYLNAGMKIPDSCYSTNSTSAINLYKTGCIKAMTISLEKSEKTIRIFGWVTLGIEVAAFTCACILATTFANQKRRENY